MNSITTPLPGTHDKQNGAKYTFTLLETPDSCQQSRPRNIPQARGPSFTSSSSSSCRGSRSASSSMLSRPFNTPATGSGSRRTPHSGSAMTPGSRRTPYSSSAMTPSDHTACVVALVEGRGQARGEIGMANIDLKKSVLTLSQFSDSQTYVKLMTKLQILQPIEIIVPNTACENGNATKLFKLITNQYQNANIATVQRKYFNETKGLTYVQQLCLPEYSTVEMEIRSKYYCLAATAALVKYIEFIQNTVYAPASLKVVFKGSEQTTMIDVVTSKNLELLKNSRDPKSEDCLYGVLNHTSTVMGARLLGSNILQPPCSLETIAMRLDAVAELTTNEELFYGIQSVLCRFLDVDHLLALCVLIQKQDSLRAAETKITNVILLKHTLELIEPLLAVLRLAENTLFSACCKTLEDPRFEQLMTQIQVVIHADTRYQKSTLNMRTQKCFAVKPNINGLLDVARRTYTEIVDDIAELVQQLAEEHKLPLVTSHNSTRGFHCQLRQGPKDNYDVKSLPGVFIKVTKFRSTLSCTTTELIKLNDRVKESLQEIYIMTNIVVTELMNDLRKNMGCLYKLAECVSMVDMLTSFAHTCTLSEYVRPEFTDTLAIKQGRHPILEKISAMPVIPNNVFASDESNFVIITGPNMSGKSTYLKQIALLQVMAQLGSFVPAEYASFRLCDQIFSRIGSDDDIETNSSTFMVEMREMNYIVRHASRRALVVIDELGRGTSTEEGVGICYAICEHLIPQKTFTFFATHFTELTNLESLYPNVENYHFEVHAVVGESGRCDKISHTHVLSKGKTKETHYGLVLAEVSILPKEVVEDAKRISAETAANQRRRQELDCEAHRQRAVFRLAQRLLQAAKNSRLDKESLRGYLRSLRAQYSRDLQLPAAGEE